jgi:ribonuclease HI
MHDEVWLFTDGAARGNPGPAAAGFRIISRERRVLAEDAAAFGIATNNQAEYQALILGLQACREFTSGRVRVGSDSELVVNQMRGLSRVKDQHLRAMQQKAALSATYFSEVLYRHFPRTHPDITRVDRLLNDLLDAKNQLAK